MTTETNPTALPPAAPQAPQGGDADRQAGFAAIAQTEAARQTTKRAPRAKKAPAAKKAVTPAAAKTAEIEARAEKNGNAARTAAAKAAPKRVMAQDAYGKYIQRQELQGHVVTTLAVEREAGSDGKPKYLSASYEVATPKGKVLGIVRFDHGSWFVGDNDETKVPTIGKGILALAGK